MEYLSKMNYFQMNHEETFLDEIVGAALATVGIWFQLSNGLSIPFPLNILLLPFTIAEYFLVWAVSS
jgi:hypothetical protein